MSFIGKTLKTVGLLALLGGGGFLIFAPGYVEKGRNPVTPHDPYQVSDAATALHKRLTIGDWHADSFLWNRDLLKRGSRGQVDFPRLAEGNVALQMFTTVTKSPAGLNYDSNAADTQDLLTPLMIAQLWPIKTWFSQTERALYQSARLHDLQAKAPEVVRVVRTKSDLAEVLAARALGKPLIGAFMGAEGAHALDGKLENLARLDAAGFRMIGLQHFFDNKLGGSLHGVSGAGLTAFGEQVVDEMVARNIIIDISHSSQKVARDVLARVKVPVVVSHTGIFSNCEIKRNFPDALMQDIAAKGGLIAIGFWEDVTCDASPAGVAKTIQAAIDLLGVDAVSLGSDFDGSVETSFDSSEMVALTDALLKAGVSEEGIFKVMGGNMVRFMMAALPE